MIGLRVHYGWSHHLKPLQFRHSSIVCTDFCEIERSQVRNKTCDAWMNWNLNIAAVGTSPTEVIIKIMITRASHAKVL